MRKIFFCLIAATLSFVSCDIPSIEIDMNPYKEVTLSTKSVELVQKGNDFSLTFLDKTNSANEGSYIISPLSLQFLLGMILDGANGQTADEICNVLGFGAGEVDAVNEYSRALLTQLPKLDGKTTLDIANAIMVDKSEELLPAYKKTVTNYYSAYVESVDFRNVPLAVSKINNWCNRNTHGLIPKIIDNLPEDAVACLLNAIYFKSKWSSPFEKAATAPETFTSESGVKSKQPMMKKEKSFLYGWNDIYQAVCLPYGNGAFSMTVVLPLEGHGVADALASLRKSGWDGFQASMKTATVDLWLPKFETKYEAKLNDLLSQMGMPTTFTPSADFSLMTKKPVYIDIIKQKAIIKVDEDGSEAAAVTIGIPKATSAGPDEFNRVVMHADHPFLYFISEKSTGAILFAGRFGGK